MIVCLYANMSMSLLGLLCCAHAGTSVAIWQDVLLARVECVCVWVCVKIVRAS